MHITISEGRNREIRRMFESIGKNVCFLKRVKIGTLTLAGLDRGAIRPLTAKEVESLKNCNVYRSRTKRKTLSSAADGKSRTGKESVIFMTEIIMRCGMQCALPVALFIRYFVPWRSRYSGADKMCVSADE